MSYTREHVSLASFKDRRVSFSTKRRFGANRSIWQHSIAVCVCNSRGIAPALLSAQPVSRTADCFLSCCQSVTSVEALTPKELSGVNLRERMGKSQTYGRGQKTEKLAPISPQRAAIGYSSTSDLRG